MIKLLIVEDSRVVSKYLEYIFNSDPEIQVIGNVSNGRLAIEFIKENKPDIITMDIDMPIMNGLEATREIMATNPIPIIIITASRNAREKSTSIKALASGALTLMEKPQGPGSPNEKKMQRDLIRMVKIMSQVKVVTRKLKRTTTIEEVKLKMTDFSPNDLYKAKRIVAIGISSGGPQVLEKIFSKITDKFPFPIVVVQHITKGFIDGMVYWLDRLVDIPIKVASDKEYLKSGIVYFAPDDFQMGVYNSKVKLEKCSFDNSNLCPSVAYLFNSLIQNNASHVLALLLTGMGKDGANELKILHDAGATTIAQDKESSLVHGMPGTAISLNAVDNICSPSEIAELFFRIEQESNAIEGSFSLEEQYGK